MLSTMVNGVGIGRRRHGRMSTARWQRRRRSRSRSTGRRCSTAWRLARSAPASASSPARLLDTATSPPSGSLLPSQKSPTLTKPRIERVDLQRRVGHAVVHRVHVALGVVVGVVVARGTVVGRGAALRRLDSGHRCSSASSSRRPAPRTGESRSLTSTARSSRVGFRTCSTGCPSRPVGRSRRRRCAGCACSRSRSPARTRSARPRCTVTRNWVGCASCVAVTVTPSTPLVKPLAAAIVIASAAASVRSSGR